MEWFAALKQFLGPEYLTSGVMVGGMALALIQYLKKMRTEDGRNEAEAQFRSDLFKQLAEGRAENKELKERADRFADERNKALMASAASDAKSTSLTAEVALLQKQLDELRAKQHGVE
jgi:hypothetical protein